MTNLIQWPRAQYWDKPWNPIIGCKPCSPACENCYAAAWAKRFGQSFEPHNCYKRVPRSGVVFCGNMTDIFGEWVQFPEVAIRKTYIGVNPDDVTATYLWLTKRVKRMHATLKRISDVRGRGSFVDYYSKDHYFGFTAEDQQRFEDRIDPDCPYGFNMWLSLEPLLGSIDLYPIIRKGNTWPFRWVVVGCESGPKRRPCKIEWIESIVDQCLAAKVPVFVKQLDLNGKCERDITKFPKHLQIRQVPWATKGENK